MNINTRRIALVLVLTPLVAAPSMAAAAGFVSVQVGSGGFGVAAGSTDWAVYGAAWNDPGWGMSYESQLAGYGEWVRVDGIGRVWRPWVAAGWRPYTHGRWVSTSVGWTWVAYEPWGYVPHHYGNWAMTTFGWVWVPGWTYQPAIVSWVSCGSYVGWYPTPPPGWMHSERAYRHGWRNGYRSGYDSGYYDGWRDARHATWVPWGRLGDENLSRHAMRYQTISRSGPSAPRAISAPDRATVTRRGATVPTATLEKRTVRVDNRELTFARPRGISPSVDAHGETTARSILSPKVTRRPRQTERPGSTDAKTRTDRTQRTVSTESRRQPTNVGTARSPRIDAAPRSDAGTQATRRSSGEPTSSKNQRAMNAHRGSEPTSNRRMEVDRAARGPRADTHRTAPYSGQRSVRRPGDSGHGSNAAAPHPSTGSRYGGGRHHNEIKDQNDANGERRNRRNEAGRERRPVAQPGPKDDSGNSVTRSDTRSDRRRGSAQSADDSRDDTKRRTSRPASK